MERIRTTFRFRIDKMDNRTLIATVVGDDAMRNVSYDKTDKPEQDDIGAFYYVIAVLLLYGFSIVLMIGSLVKRNKYDNGLSKYMKDMDKVKRLERRQEKFKTRLVMEQKRKHKHLSQISVAASTECGDTPTSDVDDVPGQESEKNTSSVNRETLVNINDLRLGCADSLMPQSVNNNPESHTHAEVYHSKQTDTRKTSFNHWANIRSLIFQNRLSDLSSEVQTDPSRPIDGAPMMCNLKTLNEEDELNII